jgi:membrane protein implicated in regulation of membrane protease activity
MVGILPSDTSFILDAAVFFLLTGVWAALLWKPFRKFRQGKKAYHNIVGTHATVESGGLVKGKTGKVKWSGAPMAARISETSDAQSVAADAEVWVHALENSVLVVDTVRPKEEDLQHEPSER